MTLRTGKTRRYRARARTPDPMDKLDRLVTERLLTPSSPVISSPT
jgi:hypothetical protein